MESCCVGDDLVVAIDILEDFFAVFFLGWLTLTFNLWCALTGCVFRGNGVEERNMKFKVFGTRVLLFGKVDLNLVSFVGSFLDVSRAREEMHWLKSQALKIQWYSFVSRETKTRQ